MYKEYTEKELYFQLEYLLKLFDVEAAKTNYDIDVKGDRTLHAYLQLKQHVLKVLDHNKYSIVDMSKLFSGFLTLKAATLRKSKNF